MVQETDHSWLKSIERSEDLSLHPRKMRSIFRGLDIEVLDVECVLLDEEPAWLDLVAHQAREPQVGRSCIFDVDADEHPARRVHRRRPELRRIHLAKALVARDLDPALRERKSGVAQLLEGQRVTRQ